MKSRTLLRIKLVLATLLLASCQQCDKPPPPPPQQSPEYIPIPLPQDLFKQPAESPEPKVAAEVPILLVPGILGSWTKKIDLIHEQAEIPDLKEWDLSERVQGVLWVVFPHLLNRLDAKGLIADKDVFAAPYDWRHPLGDNRPLKDWIDLALSQFKLTRGRAAKQVDIVAHSLGGLVVRTYVQSSEYRGDVRNVAFVASPHFGAPDAYYTWAGGRIPPTRGVGFAWNMRNHLETMNKNVDPKPNRPLVEFVRSHVRSLRDLLPAAIEDPGKESYLFGWPDPAPTPLQAMKDINRNLMLEAMNRSIGELISRVRAHVFAARGNSETLGQIRVHEPRSFGRWEDGEPEETDRLKPLDGHNPVDGDGTVPFLQPALSVFPGVTVASADHQDAVCVFTPEILKFLGLPVSEKDSCSSRRQGPRSALSLGVTTRSAVKLAVRTPAGETTIPNRENRRSWISNRLQYVVFEEPAEGSYRVEIRGEAGDHYLLATYVRVPLISRYLERAYQLPASATRLLNVELRGDRLSLVELPAQ